MLSGVQLGSGKYVSERIVVGLDHKDGSIKVVLSLVFYDPLEGQKLQLVSGIVSFNWSQASTHICNLLQVPIILLAQQPT